MAWSGGVFTLLYDFVARRDAGSPTNKIGATEVQAQFQDLADGLEACVKANGDIAATANLPMGGFAHSNVGAATARTQYARVAELQDSSHTWIAGGGTADAITATYAPSVSALTNGCLVGFRAASANATTTPTFAPNGLTAKTIVKGANTALSAGDIAGQHHECFVRYNSTLDKWVLLNPYGAQVSSIQLSSYTWVAGGGTADAITATYTPALTALTNGTLVGVQAAAANATTTPTFAPSGLTAKTIVKGANQAVVAGDIEGQYHELLLRYNSTLDKWVLLNPKYPAGTAIDISALTVDNAGFQGTDYIPFMDASESNASNRASLNTFWYGGVSVFTANTTVTAGDYLFIQDNANTAPRKIEPKYIGHGLQTIWIPAGAMTARTTNGAAAGSTESATNKIMSKTLDFDASTIEYAQFTVAFPKSWDLGTITAQFFWRATNTGNCIWALQGVAISDDDATDAAFGTAQSVTDGVTATTDTMVSAATSAITIGGTPAAGDIVTFQVYRDATNGSDTLAVDALLVGVKLTYNCSVNNDT